MRTWARNIQAIGVLILVAACHPKASQGGEMPEARPSPGSALSSVSGNSPTPVPAPTFKTEASSSNSATVSAGAGPVVTRHIDTDIDISSDGTEQYSGADGRKSNARASATVSGLTSDGGNVHFALKSAAYARGGHNQTYVDLPFAGKVKNQGADTASNSSAESSVMTVIRFQKDSPESKYYLSVKSSSAGAAPVFTLKGDDDQSPKTISPSSKPLEIAGGAGHVYFLKASLPVSASNSGGCCEQSIQGSAAVDVVFAPVPIAYEDTRTPLILNGKEAVKGQYPDTVAISLNTPWGNQLHCSGTLIAPRTVLTAAHCIYPVQGNIEKRQLLVSVGKFLSQPDEPRIAVVGQDFPHDPHGINYDPSNYTDDIGVLYIEHPFASVKSFPSIHNGTPDWKTLQNDDASITIVGFGLASDQNGVLTDEGVKRYVTIPFGKVTNKTILYSFNAAGGGACSGDSGGGTFLTQLRLLAGVTSTSSRSDCRGMGTQTRADAYGQWIRARMR